MESEMIFPIITALIFVSILVGFIIYFIILYQKKQENFRTEKAHFKEELLQAEIEIREATLVIISRELHDNFGPVSALLGINLDMMSDEISESDKMKINESKKLLKQMNEDIKFLAGSLKGENVQRIGLAKMIQRDAERINKLTKLRIDCIDLKHLPDLKAEQQVFLYRMTQEIFNNILKHSRASNVRVQFMTNTSKNKLIIEDNGVGFSANNQMKDENRRTGNGLKNMKERCRIIGAKLEIESHLNKGTAIIITF